MRPVLFEIFGFPIRSYGFFIAVAILAGLWLAKRVAARRRPEYVPLMEDFLLIAILSAIAGARIWEVTFTWEYYREHLWEIPAIWHGGISIQGAIFGGVLAAVWFARSRKINFWDFADMVTPALLLGQGIGRIGACFLNGDAYGKPTGTSLGLVYSPGTAAYHAFGSTPLWPAELFEGTWDLMLVGLTLWLLKRERPSGTVFLWYVLLYSVGRFSLEFLRADSLTIMGWKSAQVSSLIFASVAIGMLLYRKAALLRPPVQ